MKDWTGILRLLFCISSVALAAEDLSQQCSADGSCGSCEGGFLLSLGKQPDLALRHFHVAQKPVVIAEMLWNQCFLEYSVVCNISSNSLEVLETRGGCSQSPSVTAKAVGKLWEMCAMSGVQLKTRQELVDLTFDIGLSTSQLVQGCVQVIPTEAFPELAPVRGSVKEQAARLAVRKAEIGGCPTWRTQADALARGNDFAAGGSTALALAVKEYQRHLISTAKDMSKHGQPEDTFKGFALMGAIIGLKDFKNTESYLAFTKANCGIALPFGMGVIAPAKFGPTAAALEDQHQTRTYVGPWNSGISPACFHPTLPLFLSTGSEEHTQTRRMWDSAGLATMHEGDLQEIDDAELSWSRYIRDAVGRNEPTEDEVAIRIVPLLIERVFGKKPNFEETKAIAEYANFGKLCIKSKLMSNVPFFPSKIASIRKALMDVVMDSPMAKKISESLELPAYAALKRLYVASGEPVLELAVRNLADATLFAGLVGTTDMTWKCVKMQYRDAAHVRMFRRNPLDYLWELMRVQPAVQGFVTTQGSNSTVKMFFEDVPLPAGMPYKFSNSMANRDPHVFSDPSGFHPDRPWDEMGEILSWNGKLKHVVSKNYSGAPRHCPGHDLSVKIAEKVCKHLTRSLPNWGHEITDPMLFGPVKIIEQGPTFGTTGVATHFDYVMEKRCVVDRFKENAMLGCYNDTSLLPLKAPPKRSRSIEEELQQCPGFTPGVLRKLVIGLLKLADKGLDKLLFTLIGKRSPERMSQQWADEFMVALYAGITHLTLRNYASRHASGVPVPYATGSVPTFTIGDISAPNTDIDHPRFVPIEGYVPEPLFNLVFLPGFNCFQGLLRTLPWDDAIDKPENTWDYVFKTAKEKYARKKDWVLSWYSQYSTMDGTKVWPQQIVDFAALYWKQDMWDDGLERAMAFGLIGAHRLEQTLKVFAGETLPFVIRINSYYGLEVRPGFGKYRGDLYFTAEGLPAMMELPDGRQVARGDKDWQYWKFAWRSALITIITLVDHLHLAHFRAANILAGAVRKTLSPAHPLRRFLSIFTFGSIFVNMNAMHTLIGPSHVLHRAGPFKDFEGLSKLVPESLPHLVDQHRALLNKEAFDRLPPMIRETPYFQDGRLLIGSLHRFLDSFRDIYATDFCDAHGRVKDLEIRNFRQALLTEIAESHYHTPILPTSNCHDLFEILVSYLWTVTGWHRHVGTVGDYYADPDLASFSWKEGEPFARPRQHMMMSTVAAFTGSAQPKLSEDYSHLFKGIHKEEQALKAFHAFNAELDLISKEIARRNEHRLSTVGFKNVNADPNIVECSVAV